MKTEIGTIATALRAQGKKTRPVKRKPDGSAKPHRYAQAWGLTAGDFVGHFLGVNVGTPLQRKLSKLAILLFGIAVVCALIVLAANKFSNNREVIIYAVATGLSMIPACLIVVLTITMAAGTKRMVERNVIVRKLDSLEALGAVTGRSLLYTFTKGTDRKIDICSDKTGTLTQGKMVAKRAWIPSKGTYSVGTSNNPVDPTQGDLSHNEAAPTALAVKSEEDGDNEGNVKSHDELLKDNTPLQDYLNVSRNSSSFSCQNNSDSKMYSGCIARQSGPCPRERGGVEGSRRPHRGCNTGVCFAIQLQSQPPYCRRVLEPDCRVSFRF